MKSFKIWLTNRMINSLVQQQDYRRAELKEIDERLGRLFIELQTLEGLE